MSLFVLVERILAVESLGALGALKLRIFVRLFMAPQMFVSTERLVAK